MSKRVATLWFPPFEEFEKWKKFTSAPEGSYAEYKDTMNEAKRSIESTGAEVYFFDISVDEMKDELKKRELENTQNNRKICLGLMYQEQA